MLTGSNKISENIYNSENTEMFNTPSIKHSHFTGYQTTMIEKYWGWHGGIAN